MKQNLYKTCKTKMGNWRHFKTSWNIYPQILGKIKIKKGEKILDAGCGSGELAAYLNGFDLYGIDFLKNAIKKAEKKGYKKIKKGDIENIDFEDKKFDRTFCIQVFQYLVDPKKSFKELERVTKKEIVITIPNFKWLKFKSFFSKKNRAQYKYCIKNENYTDSKFLKELAKRNNLKVKIKYLSNRGGIIRDLLGDFLSSEVVGIFKLK